MLNIRRNLFETNSSSVHSITMCDQTDFDAWKNGTLWFCGGNFYNHEQLLKFMKIRKLLDDYFDYDWKLMVFTYNHNTYSIKERQKIAEQFYDTISDEEAKALYEKYLKDEPFEIPLSFKDYEEKLDYYETFEDLFISKSGDHVVAFGYYGMDN